MLLPRRSLLKAAVALPIAASASAEGAATALSGTRTPLVPIADFPSIEGLTYLNAAQKHPLNTYAAKALRDYVDFNLRVADGGGSSAGARDDAVLTAFARLINAGPHEVAFVPSTSSAENIILAGLGFPAAKGNIVTDDLHYDGSVYLYERLAAIGVEVRRVRQHGGAVSTDRILERVDGNTRLVALSLVASSNGFRHDLDAICAGAHARGALVYADVIQAAGAIPFDVKASTVDMAACSTHKWLMGDKGLGFIYVRDDVLKDGRLRATQHGWKQIQKDNFLIFEPERRGSPPYFQARPGAVGAFEVGTYALGPLWAAAASLDYIDRLGIGRIATHAASLAAPLRERLPSLGYPLLTPVDSPGHITSFSFRDRDRLLARLKRGNVAVRVANDFMRVSVSVFNDLDDIEKLIAVLSA